MRGLRVARQTVHEALRAATRLLLPAPAADDDSLRLYDVAKGTLAKTLFAKTYGCSHVCFTHAPTCVLAASGVRRSGAAPDHDVRYHSFHDNTYLRFFKVRRGQRAASALRTPTLRAFAVHHPAARARIAIHAFITPASLPYAPC